MSSKRVDWDGLRDELTFYGANARDIINAIRIGGLVDSPKERAYLYNHVPDQIRSVLRKHIGREA